MADIETLPAEVAPQRFGLPLATHTLETLDRFGILAARIDTVEIVLQLGHPIADGREIVFVVHFHQVAEQASCSPFRPHFVVASGDPVEILPDIPIASLLVFGFEVVLAIQIAELGRVGSTAPALRVGAT